MRKHDNQDNAGPSGMRIDKWLWAARFFKTRALAQAAVEGGKVRLNGEGCKCSRNLHVGDRLALTLPEGHCTLTVLALSSQRGPAPVARQLYEEDADSIAARAARTAERQTRSDPGSFIKGRPTKRDRRLLHRFNEA